MRNMIEMADEVGAIVHEVGEHNSVIIFTEPQLNDFVNKVNAQIKIVTGNDPKDNTNGNLPDHILAPRIMR